MRFIENAWRLKYSVLLLVALQAFDSLSGLLALQAGGQESNPLMAALAGQAGLTWALLAKWGVVAIVFVAVWLDPGRSPYIPAAIAILNIVYALVLANNFAVYGYASGDWFLPVAFWAAILAVAAAAVDETFFEPVRQQTPGRLWRWLRG